LGQPSFRRLVRKPQRCNRICRGRIIIVAHSLACSLINHWSKENKTHKIAGALLVAPADVDSPAHTPIKLETSPIPLLKLDYPSILITSSNDPYISVERAAF
jgi:predicted alpha/beta hydrolase family esterase